jgi:hypothetical protein
VNPILAGSPPESQSPGLEQVELLHSLVAMTGLPVTDWLNSLPPLATESPEQAWERRESLARIADRLLELDEPAPRGEDEKPREVTARRALARRAAEVHRRVLEEPAVVETPDVVFGWTVSLAPSVRPVRPVRRELAGVSAA